MIDQPDSFAVLADDLTGALDCAAAFLSSGFSPFVSITSDIPDGLSADLVSLNLDTRRMRPRDARQAVAVAVERIAEAGVKPLYVKIDSTMRGHPGLEISEAAKASGSSIAVVCPAFPATGRTVRDGELLVHEVPLTETEVGRDPLSPAKTSFIAEILRENSDANVVGVSLDIVRGGGLVGAFTTLAASDGVTLVSCDAETDDDLVRIASAALAMPGTILAGSAGLAGAAASSLARKATRPGVAGHRASGPPVLVVTASQRSLADRQLAEVARERCLEVAPVEFEVDSAGSITGVSFSSGLVKERMSAGRHVALRATIAGGLDHLQAEAVRSLADEVTAKLGQVTLDLCATTKPSTIVLIGGDTALAALSAAGAHGIFLSAEPVPGVPVGAISGGVLAGTQVATKAGAFGDDRTLAKLFDFLLDDRAAH